jgi:hypothetical protein
MSDVIVKYNNIAMSPTPIVSRSLQFVDYGLRWGQTEQIDLSCFVTGITSPAATVKTITNIFSGQFKTLEVFDGVTSVYKWTNTVVQEISFPRNPFFTGTFAPYNVKLISYQLPSGITEPVNEYSFNQSEDGTVSVNHKISAKGVKTTAGALDNAIAFVKQFTNINPFTGCAPSFIPNGSGILFGISETINRAEGMYSVNEIYKFTTGANQPYLETTSLSINDSSSEEYVTLDLTVKWQGSPVKNNLSALQSAISSYNVLTTLKSYGIATDNLYQNTFNITQDSGTSAIDFKANFISGITNEFSGFFDYTVSDDKDEIADTNTWRVEGEFICKGPISFRRTRINAFKTANGAGTYIPYLKSLITSSPLFSNYGDFPLSPIPVQFNITENTGLATLRLSATFADADTYGSLLQPRYSVDVEPSKWVYELVPAANIEGHYTLQDLQMRSQAKIKFSLSSPTSGENATSISDVSTILGALSGIYVSEAFLVGETVASGIANVSMDREYIGKDNIGDTLSTTKVHGSISNGYIRPKGYKFGY